MRNPDVMEMSHQNHQGMEDISNSEGIPLSSEGMPVTPRLDVDTPATTRSGTPASNHSFSSVSSTKPLLKQNDSQKNLEDEV